MRRGIDTVMGAAIFGITGRDRLDGRESAKKHKPDTDTKTVEKKSFAFKFENDPLPNWK